MLVHSSACLATSPAVLRRAASRRIADPSAGRRTRWRAAVGAQDAGPRYTPVASIAEAEPWGRGLPMVVGATSIEQAFKRRSRTRSSQGCHRSGQHAPGSGLEEGAIWILSGEEKLWWGKSARKRTGLTIFGTTCWPPRAAVATIAGKGSNSGGRAVLGGGFGGLGGPLESDPRRRCEGGDTVSLQRRQRF
jgi:hypothetical protein